MVTPEIETSPTATPAASVPAETPIASTTTVRAEVAVTETLPAFSTFTALLVLVPSAK